MAGCSLLYDGSDLKGKAASRPKFVATTYVTGKSSNAVALADLDGDGGHDLVIANGGQQELDVFHDQGGGQYAADRMLSSCVASVGVAAGDLNGNGRDDVFVLCQDGSASVILDGSISGSVQTGKQGPLMTLLADLTGDGKLDALILYHDSKELALLPGTGGGSFGTAGTFATGLGPAAFTLGDFDGNGSKDVAVSNSDGDSVSVFLNSGGNLTAQTPNTTHGSPWGLAVGDFDRKNGQDLAVATLSNGFLDIMLNNGNGTFPASLPPTANLPLTPVFAKAADFDRDGNLDVAVSAQAIDQLMLFYGKGNGTFEEAQLIDAKSGGAGLEVADLDGDGKMDIIVVTEDDPGALTILMNR